MALTWAGAGAGQAGAEQISSSIRIRNVKVTRTKSHYTPLRTYSQFTSHKQPAGRPAPITDLRNLWRQFFIHIHIYFLPHCQFLALFVALFTFEIFFVDGWSQWNWSLAQKKLILLILISISASCLRGRAEPKADLFWLVRRPWSFVCSRCVIVNEFWVMRCEREALPLINWKRPFFVTSQWLAKWKWKWQRSVILFVVYLPTIHPSIHPILIPIGRSVGLGGKRPNQLPPNQYRL